MSDKTLIFTHIPKTAGSTLGAVLNREYSYLKTLKIYGGEGEARSVLRQLESLPEAKKSYSLVRGHCPYGVHHVLGAQCIYVTFIRHPVSRVVSFYYHVLRTPTHYVYDRGFNENMSLKEFVVEGFASKEINDGQCYYLIGANVDDVDAQTITRHVSDNYRFVGISEMFDESLLLLRSGLDWKHIPLYRSRRVNSERPSLKSIRGEVKEIIEECNQRDLHLYRHFSKRLQQQVEEAGPAFQREVRGFQVLNGLYGYYRKARREAGRVKQQVHQAFS